MAAASTTTPRALLLTNIPETSHGFGLRRTIQQAVDAVLALDKQASSTTTTKATTPANATATVEPNNDSNDRSTKVQIHYDRTIHRTIRNGAVVVIFPNATLATRAWETWQLQSATAIVYENATLHVSYAAGRLRDHFFATLPQRHALQLDHVAAYSCRDLQTGSRMAGALTSVFLCGEDTTDCSASTSSSSSSKSNIHIVDAMACIGGTTIAFGRHKAITSVISLEMDPKRCQMLQHNVSTANLNHKVKVILPAQSCFDYLASLSGSANTSDSAHCIVGQGVSSSSHTSTTILFFDPPWGGKDYRQPERKQTKNKGMENQDDVSTNDPHYDDDDDDDDDNDNNTPFPSDCPLASSKDDNNDDDGNENFCFDLSCDTARALGFGNNHGKKNDPVLTGGGVISVPLYKILGNLLAQGKADAVAVNVPTNNAGNIFVQDMVQQAIAPHDQHNTTKECDFPFLFAYGASTQMIVIIRNTATATGEQNTSSSFNSQGQSHGNDHTAPIMSMCNATLDDMVARINHWHTTDGFREHKPRFYDYDKKRWIVLKKWKPTGGVVKKRTVE